MITYGMLITKRYSNNRCDLAVKGPGHMTEDLSKSVLWFLTQTLPSFLHNDVFWHNAWDVDHRFDLVVKGRGHISLMPVCDL